MKRSIATLTAIAATAFTIISCASNPQQQQGQQIAAQPQLSAEEQEIQKLQQQMRLDSIKGAIELQKLKQEQTLDEQRAIAAATAKLPKGSNMLLVPCGEAAYDGAGFMAALGVSAPKALQRDATLEANQVALTDIATRFAGVIKNAIDYYNKNGEVPSEKRFNENMLEGGARTIGEKIVNKYAQRTCLKHAQDKNGAYLAYQAVKVPLNDALEALATELEILKVEVDKKRFFSEVDREFASQRDAQQQEVKAFQDALERINQQ